VADHHKAKKKSESLSKKDWKPRYQSRKIPDHNFYRKTETI